MKLKIIKFLKDFLLWTGILRLLSVFNGLFFFIRNFNLLRSWIGDANRKDLLINDFYSWKRDYPKRLILFDKVAEHHQLDKKEMVYLEFGVASGSSFFWWVRKNTHPGSVFRGFDTFEGLPEDWGGFKKGAMAFDQKEAADTRAEFVKGIFQELGYSPAVATILALLCTECPRRKIEYNGKTLHVATGLRALPQGACTSPALCNLLARRLDSRLNGIAKKLGFTYTRYADDITFSGAKESAQKTGYLLARVSHIVGDEKLTVNEDKTRVQRPNARQSVTGIVVNQRPNVPRRVRRRLRAILHHAKNEGLAKQNRQNHPNFKGWVSGMIAYTRMVNPETGKRLHDALVAAPE